MRAVLLGAFLGEAVRSRFSWEHQRDCCLFVADWAVALGHPDPAADLRGRYRTERGCLRLLRREGGLAAVFSRSAERVGRPTAEPVLGDVGLLQVLTPRGPGLVGAICAGRRWVMRSPTGLLGLSDPPLACWRL